MKRWQAESILSGHRDAPQPIAVLVIVVSALMVFSPIVAGAAICAGWWK